MITEKCEGQRCTHAIVGFGGVPSLWWQRFLKRGFYHCLLWLQTHDGWILIDPLVHYTDLIFISKGSLRRFLKRQGYILVEAALTEPDVRKMSMMPYTCVETVKRFLGIRTHKIWTPHQLFRFLNRMK